MNANEVTKEIIDGMSDAEVKFWCQQFAEQEQMEALRKHMKDQVEVREAVDGPRILPLHVDSTVVG